MSDFKEMEILKLSTQYGELKTPKKTDLAYEVVIDGKKIHYRKAKWPDLIKDALSRGLYELAVV